MKFLFQKEDLSLMEKRLVRAWWARAPESLKVRIEVAPSTEALQSLGEGSCNGRKDWCPVGTVTFCQAWMRAVGVMPPSALDYPEQLLPYLGRQVQRFSRPSEVPDGWWVKPVATKQWEAGLINTLRNSLPEEPLWGSSFLRIGGEYRVYFHEGRLLAVTRYDDTDLDDVPEPVVAGFSCRIVEDWAAGGPTPSAFALDIGQVGSSDSLVLIEVTDAWAIGAYRGISPKDYGTVLYRRWRDLAELPGPQ